VSGQRGVSLVSDAKLTNSLVRATGEWAIHHGGAPGATTHIANSTLIGGPGTTGFQKDGFGPSEIVNTIIAAGTDLSLAHPNAVLSHSRYATHTGAGFTDGGGNTSAGPQFLDATVGDYRLQAASPMVDAGATHALLGTMDRGGLSRVSGSAPDIGAHEFKHPAPDPGPGPAPEQPAQSGGRDPSAGGDTGVAPIDDLAPSLRGASVRPRSFPAGSRTPRLRFTLSEPASLSIAVARELPGRRSGRRCVRPSRRLRRAKRCTRLQRAGASRKVDGTVGANSVPFISRGLKTGPHRLTITPTDAAGNRGRAATARFAIVSRRKSR
jgi:hypothetical protein